MHELLMVPVPTRAEEAVAWIEALVAADMAWHFDDSPETVIHGPTGKNLFETIEECDAARVRVGACFALLDDPHEDMIKAAHAKDGCDDSPCEWCGDGLPSERDKEAKPLPDTLTSENAIGMYMHCGKCVEELKDKTFDSDSAESPRSYARYEFGYTKVGIQVWCVRHDCNVVHIDFEGQKHPAV